MIDIAIDVIIDGDKPVLPGGIAPVDHIEINAIPEEIFDHTPVRLKIQHRFPVDQGINYKQGCF